MSLRIAPPHRLAWLSLFVLNAVFSAGLAAEAPPPPANQGEKLISENQWDEAEDWFYKHLKANPNDAEGMRNYGYVQLRRPGGDVVLAKKWLEKANQLEPDNPRGLFLLAKLYEVNKNQALANQLFDKLVELGPGEGDRVRAAVVYYAKFNRALQYFLAKDYDKAVPLFVQIAYIAPNHTFAIYEMGNLTLEKGDKPNAIKLFQGGMEALDKWAPGETWPYPNGRYNYLQENMRFQLARLLLEEGKAAEAQELLERVVETARYRALIRKRPTNPAPLPPLQGQEDLRFENAPFYYAEALVAQGKKKEAIEMLNEFVRMDIGDKEMRNRAKQRAKELKK